MILNDRKKLLTQKQLAEKLSMSPTTLWRALNINGKKAKKYKLGKCPVHVNYAGGRKYYIADEVQEWLEKIINFKDHSL